MDKNKLKEIVKKFPEKKVVVIGDLILDKYVIGEVSRISPEAPIQILAVEKENYSPGGASNVANNISSLGGNSFLIGTIGNDEQGKQFIHELEKAEINHENIIIDSIKPTTQKVRILGHNQQLLRVDYENKEYLDKEIEEKILNKLKELIKKIEVVIISDYAKGIVTSNLAKGIIQLCEENNKIVIIDPKPKHREFYKNANLITPNNKEACQMLKVEENNGKEINEIGNSLVGELNSNILITRGEKGMSLHKKDNSIFEIPTIAREVYDVTGAGDTVVGTIALALATGASLEEATTISNYAAGIVVGKMGASTLTQKELIEKISTS